MNQSEKSRFQDRLRRMREKERPVKSMKVQSELIGLGSNTLRRYERGEREPRLSELKKIAKHYGVGLDDFCWDEGEREDNF